MQNFISVSYDSVVSNLVKEINLDDSLRQAEKLSLQEIEKLNLPKEIVLNIEFTYLDKVISKIANREFEDLNSKYGEKLPLLCAMANKHFHASVMAGNIFFINGIKNKIINNNEYTQKLCNFDGYVENEGAANTAYNFEGSLFVINSMEMIFDNYKPQDLMNALGLYWLTLIENKYKRTKKLDINFLAEALDTFNLAHGSFMWDEGFKCAQEEKSEQMRKAAKKRHRENYELKEQAVLFWSKNIDPNISNDKAAEILMKIVPLSFRKLSEYVSEAKRKSIPSATNT